MVHIFQDNFSQTSMTSLPAWFRQDLPDAIKIRQMKDSFSQSRLHTVCESALCPNLGKCWGRGVATFMILGDICTRGCRFCSVKTGVPSKVDPKEPHEVALQVQRLKLRYVVITSVTRDDLVDEGAGQFVKTIDVINALTRAKIEVLIPDFSNKIQHLQQIAAARPQVIAHNIETVRRLSPCVRSQADYKRSLDVLRNLKSFANGSFIKSGFMVGLGETEEEIIELMKDLISSGCQMLTIGQYLSPGRKKRFLPVARFVKPEEFENYKTIGLKLGFKYVMSAPLVRSSYIAEEGYEAAIKSL